MIFITLCMKRFIHFLKTKVIFLILQQIVKPYN